MSNRGQPLTTKEVFMFYRKIFKKDLPPKIPFGMSTKHGKFVEMDEECFCLISQFNGLYVELPFIKNKRFNFLQELRIFYVWNRLYRALKILDHTCNVNFGVLDFEKTHEKFSTKTKYDDSLKNVSLKDIFKNVQYRVERLNLWRLGYAHGNLQRSINEGSSYKPFIQTIKLVINEVTREYIVNHLWNSLPELGHLKRSTVYTYGTRFYMMYYKKMNTEMHSLLLQNVYQEIQKALND
jgi:hypothetical protein